METKCFTYRGFSPLRDSRHVDPFREAHENAIAFLTVINLRNEIR